MVKVFLEIGGEKVLAWAEISIDNLIFNFNQVKKLVGNKVEIYPAVKAYGYGHNSVEVARALSVNGANKFLVARMEEGLELQHSGIKEPIMVLSPITEDLAGDMVESGFEPAVCVKEVVKKMSDEAAKMKREFSVHIKIDTGLGRVGIKPEELNDFADYVCNLPNIKIVGVMTHFPIADAKEKDFTKNQIKVFYNAINNCKVLKGKEITRHLANSAAILDLPEGYADAVRPGIMLYGYYPSEYVNHNVELKQVMSLRGRVIFIKSVKKGTGISYGLTYKAEKDTIIATVAMGYADGLPRHLSNKGRVIVRGQYAPIVGRICMDQTMIDVGNIDGVGIGDRVTFFGKQDGLIISVDEVAQLAQTINYEILTQIGRRIPRVIIK